MTDWNSIRVGDKETIEYEWRWQECEECGLPARFKVSFMLHHFRNNPASSGYGKDDCSYCSDYDTYACKKHKYTIKPPMGYGASSYYPLKRAKHMGFYQKKL